MSLLQISQEDLKGGRGATLPNKPYRFTVERAAVEAKENGTQLSGMLGNLRTKDGATEFEYNGRPFVIGNRKIFFRHWIDHNNPGAAKVGQGFIKKLAVSTGVAARPEDGQSVDLDFESWEAFAEALVGRDGIVQTKQRSRQGVDGDIITEPDIATYLLP